MKHEQSCKKYEYPSLTTCTCSQPPEDVLHDGVAMSEFPEKEGWDIELRDYIDKTLKPKKVGMKNLDREIIIDFVHRHIAQAKEEERARIKELAEGNKKIIGHKLDCKMCSPNCGYNKALDELIKQL